jgi:hypothetical protein
MKGTLRWHWEDDTGQVHQFDIPDSYYVPNSTQRLLSPQHLARILKSKRSERGLVCENDADMAQLKWNNGENTRTVPISQYNNCFTFRLAPGFKHFMAYCAEFGLDTATNNNQSLLASATLIEDEEDESSLVRAPEPWIPSVDKARSPYSIYTPDWNRNEVNQSHVIPHECEDLAGDLEADRLQLLKYHHQFGHVSFQRLQEMAKQGIIPKRFAKVAPPMCAACSYAKATKRPWRGKNRHDYEEIQYTVPVEMVSVDQLVSPHVIDSLVHLCGPGIIS